MFSPKKWRREPKRDRNAEEKENDKEEKIKRVCRTPKSVPPSTFDSWCVQAWTVFGTDAGRRTARHYQDDLPVFDCTVCVPRYDDLLSFERAFPRVSLDEALQTFFEEALAERSLHIFTALSFLQERNMIDLAFWKRLSIEGITGPKSLPHVAGLLAKEGRSHVTRPDKKLEIICRMVRSNLTPSPLVMY
jgi:hypothetical protein